jgi:uncharacterized membrane protein YcaP (DUF421 family)
VFNWITFRFPRAEKIFDGEPSVLVQQGAFVERNMRRNRITPAELYSEMRLAGIARLEKVAWAILEPNGKVSFIETSGQAGGHASGASDSGPR